MTRFTPATAPPGTAFQRANGGPAYVRLDHALDHHSAGIAVRRLGGRIKVLHLPYHRVGDWKAIH